jgi:Fuc2NAc and GlcNAc transferase
MTLKLTLSLVAFPLSVLVAAAALTAIVRKIVLAQGLLDVPNARSSHALPTPRGGGIAIVIASLAAVSVLGFLQLLPVRTVLALAGGLAVALVGFVDDRKSVSPAVRLLIHLAAAIWALVWLDGLPPLRIGGHVVDLGWAGYLLGVLGIVWTLNLFNFMDGIDGIAGGEAVFVAGAGAALAACAGTWGGVSMASLAFSAACCGFLLWNWPPARIFMGDVGSGFIGFFTAVLAIASARENAAALFVWLILGGVFFVDATVTFLRRLARGERIYEAHRSHAYQWLARRWGSHTRVTVCVSLVNLFWLLPLAWVATVYPALAGWIVLGALSPLALVAAAAGAGRAEKSLGT